MRICSIPECERKHLAKGYCHYHYNKWYEHGDANYVGVWGRHRVLENVPPQNCRHCGKQFIRDIHNRVYCSDECRTEGRKKRLRELVKHAYWADPDNSRKLKREWYATHKEQHKRSRIKSVNTACTICGTIKQKSDLTNEQRKSFICGSCVREHKKLLVKCYFCEREMKRNPSQARGNKLYCQDCFGAESKLGKELGITRERVRQLVNRLVSVAAVLGSPITRAEALNRIRGERLGSTLTEQITTEQKEWY